MPLIRYSCKECGTQVNKFFRVPKDASGTITCGNCNKEAKRMLRAPASTSVVTVDNGVQARAVEVNLEVVEDIKERSTKDFKKE